MTRRRGNAEELSEFLRGSRNLRWFRPAPVPQGVLDDVLEVARWTGSAMNAQPWEFLVVRNLRTLRQLAMVEGHAEHLMGASVGIVLVMAGKNEEQETFDEGRLAERIMLACSAHGVAASVGWFAQGGREAAKEILGVPEGRLVRSALSLGYPDPDPPRGRSVLPRGRKPLSELVHEERYGCLQSKQTG